MAQSISDQNRQRTVPGIMGELLSRKGPYSIARNQEVVQELNCKVTSVPKEPRDLVASTLRVLCSLPLTCVPVLDDSRGAVRGSLALGYRHTDSPQGTATDPPVVPLQDLSSPSQYDTGVALTGLSCFVTPDLARDLANDIMTLVSFCVPTPLFTFIQ